MEKSVKIQQFQRFGMFGLGLVVAFILMMFFREERVETVSGRHYKKEIATAVDGLSERDLWIEKSENDLEAIKKDKDRIDAQTAQMQKEVDALKNVVFGMAKKSFAANSIHNTKDDVSDSENQQHEVTSHSSSDSPISETLSPLVDRVEDFVSQKGVVGEGGNQGFSQPRPEFLKSSIKVVKFDNPDSEYDLEENFIFAGTYARGILLGSVTVNAGVASSSNPKPVLLRLSDMGNLPNNVKGFLKDAVVIGAAYGNLSSESVVIRLERIVKIDRRTGVGIDIPVKGYVAGENGDSDIRGVVFDRAGAMARTAAISGFLSGIADYISTSNGSSAVTFEPNSGLAQFSPQKGAKMLEQGASKGIGNAVEKYADFVIKRAEQMQPVIKIDGGRNLTIVFTESVKASSINMKKVRKRLVQKGYKTFGGSK